MSSEQLSHSPLGKQSQYVTKYEPGLLCPIPREKTWLEYGLTEATYTGYDIWNAYELSWLNDKGLPQVTMAEFWVPENSPNLIESKSFKLYLNSFSQSKFNNPERVIELLESDLSSCAGKSIKVKLISLNSLQYEFQKFEGKCLDDLDINIENYSRDSTLLQTRDIPVVNEKLFSHLLKSNCPITGQPDWGSIYVEYSGNLIEESSLLKYIISYREQCGFHEKCTENIFLDIMQRCQPDELTVYTRYLRRGGLDINPYRSTRKEPPKNIRLFRQ